MAAPPAQRHERADGRAAARGGEAGFALVEVLVALVVLLIGVFATFQILDLSTRAGYSAQRNQVAVNKAQREMEALRRLDYKQVALTGSPAACGDANLPCSRVGGSSFDLEKSPSATDLAPLATDATGGTVNPGPETFSVGKITGRVYRYVVFRDDPACAVTCPGTEDYKRVVIAIKLDGSPLTGTAKSYIEVQSDFTNPHEGVLGEEAPNNPNPGQTTTAQQFWLYDTPCTSDVRSDPSSHDTHNTAGDCSDSKTPDLMGNVVPPDSAPDDPALPALNNYAQEIAGGGEGLRMAEHTGCDPSETDPQRIHRWVTKKFAADFAMTGKISFAFYTRTVGAAAAGSICVRLARRQYVDGSPVDQTIATKDFALGAWPAEADGWTALSFTIDFSSLSAADRTLAAGERLLFGLFVKQESDADLQFMYDHPDFASRLEIQTSTPLE